MSANFRIDFPVVLADVERDWIATTITDAVAMPDTGAAARLIEARVETLIRRRLEPFAEFAADVIAYEESHADGPDTPTRLAFAHDILELVAGR